MSQERSRKAHTRACAGYLTAAPSAPPSGWDSPNRLGASEWVRPRGAAGPPPPHTAERGLGRGGTALPEPRPSPPPESPAPPSFPSALGATAIALSATCLLRELRSGRPRHGGVLRPDHVAAATPESPRGPEATAQPFLRPGHGQPRRPPVCGAARGTRSGAREGGGRRGGRRTARDRARDAEDTGRVRGAPWGPGLERSAGSDGPPAGGGAGNEALPGWKNTLRCRFVPSARNFVE